MGTLRSLYGWLYVIDGGRCGWGSGLGAGWVGGGWGGGGVVIGVKVEGCACFHTRTHAHTHALTQYTAHTRTHTHTGMTVSLCPSVRVFVCRINTQGS